MLRCGLKGLAARRVLQRNAQTDAAKNWHSILGVHKNASLKGKPRSWKGSLEKCVQK